MPEEAIAPATELPDEISRAVGNIWTHYSRGVRPADVQTEIRANVITCVLTGAVGAFDKGMALDDEPAPARKRSANAYKLDVRTAVRKLTHTRVDALISKHDAKTDVAREVIILQPRR